jgi:branched-chain amino acid transport system substrate-binding protein
MARRSLSRLAAVLALLLSAAAIAPANAEILIGIAAPLTGPMAWAGGETKEGAKLAVADLNEAGGVLGQRVEMIVVDDYCDEAQAVAAARKLIEAHATAIFGHDCSGAAIPASKIYAEAGVLMISDFATNPKLTEQGFRNVFRVVGRDDVQGRMVGDLLAERWGNARIAILHDGEAYGKGLAAETKRRLNSLGVKEAIFRAIEPGKADYLDIVLDLRSLGVDVLYYGGYVPEAGIIMRQAHERGYGLQLVMGDSLGQEDFWLIAGVAGEGALFTLFPDPRRRPEAAALLARMAHSDSGGFTVYAAIQAWAQAVEKTGTFETEAVAKGLRTQEFDTVLGRIGFDAKGDVTGYDTFVWYVWKDGEYVPVDPAELTD